MYHALNLTYRPKDIKVQYWKDRGLYFYKGVLLPEKLVPYKSEDFSFARWHEDERNSFILPIETTTPFHLKDHQKNAARKIIKSYNQNWSGFLLADQKGLGKTLSCIAGIAALAKQQKYGNANKAKLLIVCPLRAIPQWRLTLKAYPDALKYVRPMIINYDQLLKLLETPPNARLAKKRTTKRKHTAKSGKSLINWDYVIFDEAHKLKNYPKTITSLAAAQVAQLEKPYIKGHSPFVVFNTATPGATVLNFSVMSNFLSKLIDPSAKNITPKKWGQFLKDKGFAIDETKDGWAWAPEPRFGKNSKDPKVRNKYVNDLAKSKLLKEKDSQRIGLALSQREAPFMKRSPEDIAGWPTQNVIATPISLTPKQSIYYKKIWNEFREYMRLSPSKKDSKSYLVESLRYRQKSSFLKVESMIPEIVDFVDEGYQVFISCEFIETINEYKELLTKKKIKVSDASGNSGNVNQEIENFQKGKTQVILSTICESISLHRNQILEDGSRATSNERITIIHDIRQNNIDTDQIMGRCHRDGENSVVYFPYFENTVEAKVVNRHLEKTLNMSLMLGIKTEDSRWLEKIFLQEALAS